MSQLAKVKGAPFADVALAGDALHYALDFLGGGAGGGVFHIALR
jgi:hypothetical protein